MKEKVFNRPDEAALCRVLNRYHGQAEELILRLAWQAGLSRPEMHALTWEQVDLDRAELHLPTHTVPLEAELLATLRRCFAAPYRPLSPYVLLSAHSRTHLSSVHISRLASTALATEEVLQGVSLKNLRDDFVIRALESHGKAYAMRVSGLALNTLYSSFGQYLSHAHEHVIEERSSMLTMPPDEEKLLQLLSREGKSPAGIALWLIWKSNLSLTEIAALTWEQIDLAAQTVTAGDRTVPLHAAAAQLLQEVKSARTNQSDPHVLLTPRSHRPFELERLNVVVQTALRRGGFENLPLKTLLRAEENKDAQERIFSHIRRHRFITAAQVRELLSVTKAVAWRKLHSLTEQGQLIKIGLRYYLPGTVVPPEEHFSVIRAKLDTEGAATVGELAHLLGVENRACYWILSRFVEEGKLQRQGQVYKLSEEK